jgi:large subunit ribosomal protein L24
MMVKRHTKPSQQNAQGGIIEKEGSIHLSNVMPLDPGNDKPTRVKIKKEGEVRRRVAKSGAVIEAAK